MKKETPKSYEQQLYESCPALANYESKVLGEKVWVEFLDGKGRTAANMLMPAHHGGAHHPESVPPDLLMYMKRFIRDYGQGDEAKGVKVVFNALVAAGGHRHAPSMSAFIQRMNSGNPAPAPAATPEVQQ